MVLLILIIILVISLLWWIISKQKKDKPIDKTKSNNKSFSTTYRDIINIDERIVVPNSHITKKEITVSNSKVAKNEALTVFTLYPKTESLLKVQTNDINIWSEYVIENVGGYYDSITNCGNLKFSFIRNYCAQNLGSNSQLLPHRGVVPLNTERELNQYIFSYGNMHYAKMCDAIDVLPHSLWQEKLHIVDWGCGQGIASFAFLTKQRTSSIAITLIEPGILALKRAALNLKEAHKRYSSGLFKCRTLNKDFDSLRREDIDVEFDYCKLHFFSNVLDIENRYSLNQLIELIKTTQKGKNYFVCVSPYQNEEKRRRIRSFVDAFRNCDDFTLYYAVENRREDEVWKCNNRFKGYSPGQYCVGECDTCDHKWTRIIRVFSVNL